MKRIIYTTVTVSIASLLFSGLAMGSGMDTKASGVSAVEEHMSGTATDATPQPLAAQPLDMDQVRELQTLLNEQGYNTGVPDGMIGPSTTAAIRQFQLDHNLANSGNPDQETLRLLSPDTEKQEFFGLAPEFGEQKELMTPEPTNIPENEMLEEVPKKFDY